MVLSNSLRRNTTREVPKFLSAFSAQKLPAPPCWWSFYFVAVFCFSLFGAFTAFGIFLRPTRSEPILDVSNLRRRNLDAIRNSSQRDTHNVSVTPTTM